jgi:diacylglycerol kinase
VLPEEPDNAAVEDWLLRVRREFWVPAQRAPDPGAAAV